MSPVRRALVAITSAQPPLYPEGKETDRAVWKDHSSEFHSMLDNLLKLGDINPEKYKLFFASDGYVSLINYPDTKGLQAITSKIFTSGGIVSAVCHGGAIFPCVIDPNTNKSIIDSRRVTGFTTRSEEEENNRPTVEASAASYGATYVSPPGPLNAFTITDGRVVTGANPASTHVAAEAAVAAFDKL
ncbi:hypothetical protein ASPTUDRAFT_59405 [Aspergillus tubingensis CBS 134.48]|uniref:D-lactate dehydratase n=1 Tax=Aspergillus tubingensis (strain CBS 134.48) TaxID=767770 RepID=A0A1L9MQQ6_ASPTC|nr:hypothetical protein ASPTUDRAFT_59405 [Aspergillus tubingensis CBS 134.48]